MVNPFKVTIKFRHGMSMVYRIVSEIKCMEESYTGVPSLVLFVDGGVVPIPRSKILSFNCETEYKY